MNHEAKSRFSLSALRNSGASRDLVCALLVLIAGGVMALQMADFDALEWTRYLALGLVAVSFAYVWGQGGIFSFGQAALFGIGGYTYGIVSINLLPVTGETMTAVLAAVAVSTLFAGAIGYFMFYGNVSEVYVAIVTLSLSLVLMTVMESTSSPNYRIGEALFGGSNGMLAIPPLTVAFPGIDPVPLNIPDTLMVLLVVLVAVVVGLRFLGRSAFGRILSAVRQNELRTELLGYDVRRQKLFAFMVSAAIAGLGGAAYSAWGMFISPAVFGLSMATMVAIWVLVGGRTSLVGAVLGVILIEQLSGVLGGSGGQATPIILGAVLIAVVMLLPSGLVPTLVAWIRRLVPALAPQPAPLPVVEDPEKVLFESGGTAEAVTLTTSAVTKRFGGVHALKGVDLSFQGPGVQCLLGSNGAGKSTYFNLVTGRYRASSGTITYRGQDITRWRADRRARAGLGIKLQVSSIYLEATLFENLWLAAYSKSRDAGRATERATAALEWLGFGDSPDAVAKNLAHGQKQWLEIGMVLASDPEIVLLDEPTAGMTRDETARTAELIHALAKHKLVIVVEHDMEFIRLLDAPVTMFHRGEVLTSGSLADLRADERVLDAYLGRKSHDAETR